MWIQIMWKQGGSVTVNLDSLSWVEQLLKNNDWSISDISTIRFLDDKGRHIEQKPTEIVPDEFAEYLVEDMSAFFDEDFDTYTITKYMKEAIEDYINK